MWFIAIIDGPHAGERLMPASVEGVYEPLAVAQRVEVQRGVVRFTVEIVDVEAATARMTLRAEGIEAGDLHCT